MNGGVPAHDERDLAFAQAFICLCGWQSFHQTPACMAVEQTQEAFTSTRWSLILPHTQVCFAQASDALAQLV